MAIHEDAIDLMQYFTGCAHVAYACPSHISHGGQWPYMTIGYGHSGPNVNPGMRITSGEARDLLARDLANVEAYVTSAIKVPLEPHQFGALCSLVMHIKPTLFATSQVLAIINTGRFGALNAEAARAGNLDSLDGLARAWAQYREIASGDNAQALAPLVARRACELELFFYGRWTPPHAMMMPQLLVDPEPPVEMFADGMRSSDVEALHDALAAAGFPTTCQDAYTWVTAQAVRAFQEKHGLEPDGVYGPQTARKLNEVLNWN
jgi:GH24 family phage-related lysozyme (muramidase)